MDYRRYRRGCQVIPVMIGCGLVLLNVLPLGAPYASAQETPPITQLLRDIKSNDPKVRRSAADALGQMNAAAELAVPALTGALKDADTDVRAHAGFALISLGTDAAPALPALIALLRDPEASVRRNAAEVVGGIQVTSPAVVEALTQALQDENPYVSLAAAHALLDKVWVNPAILTALTRLLKDPATSVRRSAAETLEKTAEGSAPVSTALVAPALTAALRDKDKEVRLTAAFILVKIGADYKPAAAVFIEALREPDVKTRIAAAYALGGLKAAARPAVPTLIDMLTDENINVRYCASYVLWDLGDVAAPAAPALARALKDRDWQMGNRNRMGPESVRSAAAAALVRLGAAAHNALPILIDLLTDGGVDVEVRRTAADVLREISHSLMDRAEQLPSLQVSAVIAQLEADERRLAAMAPENPGETLSPSSPMIATKEAVHGALERLKAEHQRRAQGAAARVGQ